MKNHVATSRPWIRDFLALEPPAQLSRADFVARYLPRYARDYTPPTGIRLRPDGRPTRTTRGNIQAQVTKRDHRIDEAFAAYLSDYAAAERFWAQFRNPTAITTPNDSTT